MGATKRYRPNEVTVQLGDEVLQTGLVRGEFLKVMESGPQASSEQGLGGEVVVNEIDNEILKLEITALGTSDANDVLCNMADGKTPADRFKPFFARDENGRSLHECTHCWVTKKPDKAYDQTSQPLKWELEGHKKRNEIRGAAAL